MLIILYIGIPIFLDSTLIHLHLKAVISLQPLLYKNGNEHLNKDTIIGLMNYNYKQGLNKNFQKTGALVTHHTPLHSAIRVPAFETGVLLGYLFVAQQLCLPASDVRLQQQVVGFL